MATYKYYAFTYTTPNDEHEGQYGVDIVAQQIQYGEYGVMSNTGPAIHAWYGQMQDSGSSWSPKKQQLSSNVKDGAWLVGGLRYMTTAVFLATPRVLSGQVPSRGPEIQPPGRSSTTRHYPPAAVGIGPPAAAGQARLGMPGGETGCLRWVWQFVEPDADPCRPARLSPRRRRLPPGCWESSTATRDPLRRRVNRGRGTAEAEPAS